MSISGSDDSSSSTDTSVVNFGVKSAFYAIKAAMRGTLAVIMVLVHHTDEVSRNEMLQILNRHKKMCEWNSVVKPTRLAYLDDWKKLGTHALETIRNLEDAYKTVQNNMNKLETVEKLYGKKKTKEMIQATCSLASKTMKVKSEARSKSSKKKQRPLLMWHDCVKTARKNLGIKNHSLPKRGTALYDECKRLMAGKAIDLECKRPMVENR